MKMDSCYKGNDGGTIVNLRLGIKDFENYCLSFKKIIPK